MIITISGFHGTGKTTVAKQIAHQFKMNYIAAGDVFRQMAKERKMTLNEFSTFVEQHPEIDREIDERTIMEAKKGNVVLDALLAAWMTQDISDINILLITDQEIRIKRIAQRESRSFEEVKQETLKREQSEIARFKKIYNINLNDYSIYDLILNTGLWSQETVEQVIIQLIKAYLKSNQKKMRIKN
ncbi:MAG: (d)CMP kinase [Candidatus Helarchaeota archaeon]